MSGELTLDTIALNQTGKETTLNEIFGELEAAIAGILSVDLSAANGAVTLAQLQRCGTITCSGAAVARNLTLTAAKRLIAIVCDATCTAIVTAIMGTTSIAIPPGKTTFVALDGTANGMVALGGGSSGATTLAALTDVDETTPPTTGQSLVYDSTSTKWKPETISGALPVGGSTGQVLTKIDGTDGHADWETPSTGGGGGGGGSSDPDLSPGLAVNFTAMPSSGGLTLTDKTGKGLVISSAYNAAGGAGIKAVNTGWASVITKAKAGNLYGQYGFLGLLLHDSVANKQIFFGFLGQNNSALPNLEVVHMNNWSYDNRTLNQGIAWPTEWFRIRHTSGSYYFDISCDGDNWCQLANEVDTTYIGPATHYGMCMYPTAGGYAAGGRQSAIFENWQET